MKLIDLEKVGIHENNGIISFGVLLPKIKESDNYKVKARVIHENEQFLQKVAPYDVNLHQVKSPCPDEYGEYWTTNLDLNKTNAPNSEFWGKPGKYVYRYSISHPIKGTVDWIIDPFTRESGNGKLSAFTLGYTRYDWDKYYGEEDLTETKWKTPDLNDIILYEMMIQEFSSDLSKSIQRLDYLKDLGINTIEIMPLTNVEKPINWGYDPVGFFGVDERYGNHTAFKQFVHEAHRRGIAIIVDIICGHVDAHFPYHYLYNKLGFSEKDNPFIGHFGKFFDWGKSVDYNQKFVQDYFFTVCMYWLEKFHIDGFRYDCVPEYYVKDTNIGFSKLVSNVYEAVKGKIDKKYWKRFKTSNNEISLIQCAEQIESPVEILNESYSNCTWQDETYKAAKMNSKGSDDAIISLGHRLGLVGFPVIRKINDETIRKTALQYIENHDKARFLCEFEPVIRSDGNGKPRDELMWEGDRNLFYMVQPYLIGIFTAVGIPMIFQGQELLENYYLKSGGHGRIKILRSIRWDYFYDSPGNTIINLVRKLIRIRNDRIEMRRGKHHYFDKDDHDKKGMLAYSRWMDNNYNQYSVIVLNFSGENNIRLKFKKTGVYKEEIFRSKEHFIKDKEYDITVTSNYGKIFTFQESD